MCQSRSSRQHRIWIGRMVFGPGRSSFALTCRLRNGLVMQRRGFTGPARSLRCAFLGASVASQTTINLPVRDLEATLPALGLASLCVVLGSDGALSRPRIALESHFYARKPSPFVENRSISSACDTREQEDDKYQLQRVLTMGS